MTPTKALTGPLVDPAALAAALADRRARAATGRVGDVDDLVVADVRWYLDGRSGAAAYTAGHVPGARFVDLDTELSASPGPGTGRHPLPAPAAFLAAMAGHGVGPTTLVVAYDDAGGSTAARLWWMLRQLGRPAAVLDGGIGAWVAAGGDLEAGPPAPADRAARIDAGPAPADWPAGSSVATAEVLVAVAGGAVLLDARSAARYRGDPGAPDPVAGHIPGARSAPWQGNLDPHTGRFLPPDALRARFQALGVGADTAVVATCGSGVTACHDLLALEVAGLRAGRLYPGSWSAWSADPARPVATGPEPG
ncbi:MAG TPA: sulfurtransferase [Acidimicrobiales bacterium]|nr:sulfurtransferase [Acidimicrobiales bacterium]